MQKPTVSRRELLSLLAAAGLSGAVVQAKKKDDTPHPIDSAAIVRRLDKVARLLERATSRLGRIQEVMPPAGPPLDPEVRAALMTIQVGCANVQAIVDAMLNG